jgi:hypothetical protein
MIFDLPRRVIEDGPMLSDLVALVPRIAARSYFVAADVLCQVTTRMNGTSPREVLVPLRVVEKGLYATAMAIGVAEAVISSPFKQLEGLFLGGEQRNSFERMYSYLDLMFGG